MVGPTDVVFPAVGAAVDAAVGAIASCLHSPESDSTLAGTICRLWLIICLELFFGCLASAPTDADSPQADGDGDDKNSKAGTTASKAGSIKSTVYANKINPSELEICRAKGKLRCPRQR